MSITSDNIYAGGLTFDSASFSAGSYNGAAPGGGLHFDLPLATVAAFNGQAMNFTQQNITGTQSFLSGIINNTQGMVQNTGVGVMSSLSNILGSVLNVNQNELNALIGINSLNNATNLSIAQSGNSGGGGGGCYITTAICQSLNKPDNCEELEMMRNFRDNYMRRDPELTKLVDEYYLVAPKLVAMLNENPDKREVYSFLKDFYLTPAIDLIKGGNNIRAVALYTEMVNALNRYLKGYHAFA